MNNRKYSVYCLSAMAGVAAMCSYPIYMGIKVVARMMTTGAIPYKEYPKYVIPYTPIGLSLIAGVLLIPLLQKIFKKLDMIAGSAIALAVFFVTELLMESKVLVEADTFVVLGSWQMSLCYVPPEEYRTRTWEAVDILLGGYNPYFKLHFYLISVVIIIAFMNFLYGFASMILTRDYKRKKALILQTVSAVLFLAMCIWACFTAFYRTGELTVKPVSAVLMGTFFALLGVTAGVFVASLAIGKKEAALDGHPCCYFRSGHNADVFRRDDLAERSSVQIRQGRALSRHLENGACTYRHSDHRYSRSRNLRDLSVNK